MRIRERLQRYLWRSVFRLAQKRVISGIEVGVLLPDEPGDVLFAITEEALTLIGESDPRQLRRLRQLASILIFGTVGPQGAWIREARLVRLKEAMFTEADTQPVHVAATIVHETTHAWLEQRGIAYVPDRRTRIEALCYRAEANFARRIPGGEALAAYYKRRSDAVRQEPAANWSDAAFDRHQQADMIELGVPRWLVRALSWSSRRTVGNG